MPARPKLVKTETIEQKISRIADEEDSLKEQRKAINDEIGARNAELVAEGIAKNAKKFVFKLRTLAPDEQQQELISMRQCLRVFRIEEGETPDMFDG